MKHKYHEVIRAWSEGISIQYRIIFSDALRSPWVDLSKYSFDKRSPNFDAENIEWRIKPPELLYRVALYQQYHQDENVRVYYVNTHNNREYNDKIEEKDDFVRWLTEWTEVDI